jgi:adenylate cyclase
MSVSDSFQRSTWLGPIIGATLTVVLGLFCFDSQIPITQTLHRKSYDLSFHLRQRTVPKEVVLVYMDDASYEEFNPSYDRWDRRLHARLLDRLTEEGAKAVVFDVIFSGATTDDPDADNVFEQAIERNGNVILGADLQVGGYSAAMKHSESLMLPYEPFEFTAASTGFVQFDEDADFLVRKHRHQGQINPQITSMTWETALWTGASHLEDESSPIFKEVQEAWVNYYGPPLTLPKISYHQVIQADGVAKGFFKDKIVFVGANIRTLNVNERKDEFRSPYADFLYVKQVDQFMPGVEVHATILLNLIRGDWLRRVPLGTQGIVLALTGLFLGIGIGRMRPLTAVPVSLLLAALVMGISQWLFQQHRYWFPWLIIVAVQIPAAMLWSVTFNAARLYVQRQLLRQSLNLYLSPRLVKAFLGRKDRDFLKPGAEKQEVTILFSDIAGFTAATEGMDSDELARSMNEYFQCMVENGVHPQDGTVIKFIGDSIFALWNAPESQHDHALRACKAAIALDQQSFAFREGDPVRTRIGIHTGIANVGNFGSDNRVDYTAIGENINLASRIEGLNKYLRTNILISAETRKLIGDELKNVRYLGKFRLSGFEKSVGISELMPSEHPLLKTPELLDQFEAARLCHDQGNMEEAVKKFQTIQAAAPEDGPTLFYTKRCQSILHGALETTTPDRIIIGEK